MLACWAGATAKHQHEIRYEILLMGQIFLFFNLPIHEEHVSHSQADRQEDPRFLQR